MGHDLLIRSIIELWLNRDKYIIYILLKTKIIIKIKIIIYIFVDPAFSIARMRFPLDGETRFLFEKLILLIQRNDLESPLIFVLFFLKGKQNKKEKP